LSSDIFSALGTSIVAISAWYFMFTNASYELNSVIAAACLHLCFIIFWLCSTSQATQYSSQTSEIVFLGVQYTCVIDLYFLVPYKYTAILITIWCTLLSNGEQVLAVLKESIKKQAVDVILMDISMPIKTGIEAVQSLQTANIDIPVIMLTTFDDHQLVLQAIQAGAKGYLLKDVSLETLVDGIRTVNEGNTLIQPAITERIIQGLKNHTLAFTELQETPGINEKEKEVLRLMA
jgi:CheY-like chemotaxis protein